MPEKDVDRTSEERKASSVQFIHFHFSNEQINLFNNSNTKISIGIEHNLYSHSTTITEANRKSLANDFI